MFRKSIRPALERRLASLKHPQWVEAMTILIQYYSPVKFRWHDSGDMQNEQHLEQILEAAANLPNTKFWVSTKEEALAEIFFKNHMDRLANMTLRVSSSMIGQAPLDYPLTCTSGYNEGVQCPAHTQDNQCLDCEMCWDKTIKNINYKMH